MLKRAWAKTPGFFYIAAIRIVNYHFDFSFRGGVCLPASLAGITPLFLERWQQFTGREAVRIDG
jgi:hypothetical protein